MAVATVERGSTRMADRGDLRVTWLARAAHGHREPVDRRGAGRRHAPGLHRYATAGLARAADEVARWIGGQLELAEPTRAGPG